LTEMYNCASAWFV